MSLEGFLRTPWNLEYINVAAFYWLEAVVKGIMRTSRHVLIENNLRDDHSYFSISILRYPNLMFHIVLYEPEIPANTGNIIRLCANCGAKLHLIEPLGFDLDDKKLRRAGLDYHEYANLQTYTSYDAFIDTTKPDRIFSLTTKASRRYTDISYKQGDFLLFGPETRGLPQEILDVYGEECCLRIPMLSYSRSMNLSNAAAVVTYEAWRQLDFNGSDCF